MVSSERAIASSLSSVAGVRSAKPALLTSTSSPPSRATACATSSPGASGMARSARRTCASAPSARASAATRSAASALRRACTASAVPGAAMARTVAAPMPEDAPVTRMRLTGARGVMAPIPASVSRAGPGCPWRRAPARGRCASLVGQRRGPVAEGVEPPAAAARRVARPDLPQEARRVGGDGGGEAPQGGPDCRVVARGPGEIHRQDDGRSGLRLARHRRPGFSRHRRPGFSRHRQRCAAAARPVPARPGASPAPA
jgi:hypothetical protein